MVQIKGFFLVVAFGPPLSKIAGSALAGLLRLAKLNLSFPTDMEHFQAVLVSDAY